MEKATTIMLLGAGCFGLIIGWQVYLINRYRTAAVDFGDLATVIGIIGGGAILSLFPAGSELFGAYGIGLALGFFSYFIMLLALVSRSKNFDSDFFLDGRRKSLGSGSEIPEGTAASGRGMGEDTAAGSRRGV